MVARCVSGVSKSGGAAATVANPAVVPVIPVTWEPYGRESRKGTAYRSNTSDHKALCGCSLSQRQSDGSIYFQSARTVGDILAVIDKMPPGALQGIRDEITSNAAMREPAAKTPTARASVHSLGPQEVALCESNLQRLLAAEGEPPSDATGVLDTVATSYGWFKPYLDGLRASGKPDKRILIDLKAGGYTAA